jgi:hypothetical protein
MGLPIVWRVASRPFKSVGERLAVVIVGGHPLSMKDPLTEAI